MFVVDYNICHIYLTARYQFASWEVAIDDDDDDDDILFAHNNTGIDGSTARRCIAKL